MKNTHNHFGKAILLLTSVLGLVAIVHFSSDRIPFFNSSNPQQVQSIDKTSSANPMTNPDQRYDQQIQIPVDEIKQADVEIPERPLTFQDHLAIQAELRLQSDVTYDGSYRKIAYPMGDVPENIGVCTDVVIRSFRGLGIDLQQRVHEDMKRNFRSYPRKWKLTRPDPNIDHRRVPNLMTFFDRAGASLPITNDPMDYIAGNVVAWDLGKVNGKNMVHIGIVSNYVSEHTSNPLIVHNIGAGPQMNDMLFDYKIIGHYQYGELKTALK